MLNSTKAFILSLFDVFLVYIVLGNFLGWSGGSPSLTGYNYSWDNTYIGFQSIFTMADDFSYMVNRYSISYNGQVYPIASMKSFLYFLSQLTSAITFGIPEFLTEIINNSVDIFGVVKFIATLLLQPIVLTAYLALVLSIVLWWIVSFISCFLKFCGGAYNIEFADTADVWSQWDSMVSSWSWNVPVV